MNTITILQASGSSSGDYVTGVVLLLTLLALAWWTLKDAAKNSSHPALLWALIVFLIPFPGIVLYLILGRNRT